MKTILKFSLAIVLVLLEIYLAVSYVGGNAADKKRVEQACATKCKYDANSYLWEFSSEMSSRGFTTKEECFNFCVKKEQGFALMAKRYASAFFSAIFFSK